VNNRRSSRSFLRSLTGSGGLLRGPLARTAVFIAAAVLTVAAGRWTTADTGRVAGPHRGVVPAGVSGKARVVDGDTIEVGGVRIRLFGIDAPELHQSCRRPGGERYACGDFARGALVAAIGGQAVSCSRRDVDKYGRMVGVCTGSSGDLAGNVVTRGAAMAYRHYSLDYVDEEERARRDHTGIWQGSFEAPWEFRHNEPAKHASPAKRTY
jgi:endonuclease YncB( thermonuclease family)